MREDRDPNDDRRNVKRTRILRGAKIILERFDLKRNGRLGEEKMLSGFTKTELFGDRAENLQAEILQLGHGEDYLRMQIFVPSDRLFARF